MTAGELCYRCPGEQHPIPASVHLGRLASFYPACRECAHRHETGNLSSRVVRQLGQLRPQRARWTDEGFAGAHLSEMTAARCREASQAFGRSLAQDAGANEITTVLLASDGRPWSAELVAAAATGLQWAGRQVLDAGAVTVGALGLAMSRHAEAAGLYLGAAGSELHQVTLQFWGPAARPWSNPGSLESVAAEQNVAAGRSTRAMPGVRRVSISDHYLEHLRPSFHALRPLRFVVDTLCEPLLRMLEQCLRNVGCREIRARSLVDFRRADGPVVREQAEPDRRLSAIGEQVRQEQAHFGIWISGDGQACQLLDECGRTISWTSVLGLLARQLPAEEQATIVGETPSGEAFEEARSHTVATADATTREAMYLAMQSHGALLGGGPSGRYWFAGRQPYADALECLTRLLSVLSETDRPASALAGEPLEADCTQGKV